MSSSLAKNAKSRALELIARILARKDDIARAFYDIGVALRELHENKLYAVLGYKSFDEMISGRGLMSSQYARRLIQVAAVFDREEAQRLGAEKAYALVRYCARTKQEDEPAQYLLDGFPTAGGKRRPIDEVGVRDITIATRIAVLRQKGQHGASEAARRNAVTAAKHVHARLAPRTSDEVAVRHVFRRGSWWLEVLIPAEMERAIR